MTSAPTSMVFVIGVINKFFMLCEIVFFKTSREILLKSSFTYDLPTVRSIENHRDHWIIRLEDRLLFPPIFTPPPCRSHTHNLARRCSARTHRSSLRWSVSGLTLCKIRFFVLFSSSTTGLFCWIPVMLTGRSIIIHHHLIKPVGT